MKNDFIKNFKPWANLSNPFLSLFCHSFMWVLSSRNLSGLGVNFLGMTMETTFKGMMLSGMPRSLRRGRMHSSWGADAAPGDVIAECASCKEHVLCGFRAVLDPVAGGFLNCWFKANNNVQTGSLGK